MKCVDFDSQFARWLKNWMEKHQGDYADVDQMELAVPQVYARFLDTPAPWLGGEKPGAFFEKYQDPGMLVDWLEQYLDTGVPVPDMLLNRISALGEEAAPLLMALLHHPGATGEKRMLAVTLLREIGSLLPLQTYVDWQEQRAWEDELCDNALDSLEQMGEAPRAAMLAALPGATPPGQEALLSVLTRLAFDEEVLDTLLRLFERLPQRRAILSAYLGRLGDPRALPALMLAAQEKELAYLDYIELRAAIEALGGEAPERDFPQDPGYDAISGLRP